MMKVGQMIVSREVLRLRDDTFLIEMQKRDAIAQLVRRARSTLPRPGIVQILQFNKWMSVL
jgi:hypothetical protein